MRRKRGWAAVLALVLVFTLAACGGSGTAAPSETVAPTPTPDPAAALVGTWTNKDGIGLKFTSGGTVKLSGFGISLGGDTFSYEVTGENELTLTATVGGLVSLDLECPYGIVGDTLHIQIQEYDLRLTKK